MGQAINAHDSLMRLPLVGFALFVLFYVIAALHYPGGSYTDPYRLGFSFEHNYLCDLLDDRAINNKVNSARMYARISLGILCVSLSVLWLYLPRLFDVKRNVSLLISFCGLASMATTVFLAWGAHDIVVRIAGVFGVIAFILTLHQLYNSRHLRLLTLGIVSIVLVLSNYVIYETGIYRDALPLIQKITFISCLSWFVLLNVRLLRNRN